MIPTSSYEYRAFGLNIASAIRLDGLLPSSGEPDVQIREGRLPVEIPGPETEPACARIGEDGFAFRVPEIGRFLVTGDSILVEKDERNGTDSHLLFVLGTCMGALLMQRNLLPVHGSALQVGDKHIILTGESGAGKSTLAAAFNRRGYSFLADDVSALEEKGDGSFEIVPAFPRQKLWRDTAEHFFGSAEGLERIPGSRDKYHVPMEGLFITEPRRADALFQLSVHEGDDVRVTPVTGPDKLAVLMNNVYRPEIVGIFGREREHFLKCARLASRLSVYNVERPAAGFTVEQQIRAIEEQLNQG
ncbi:hypothetical protein F4V43_17600 [Paenibacillus spiritus]|uniref:Aldolase n=1 Tax=Paenibacillus spiritus TaxID=2496557 RepID=A0A5J5FVU8_9BACL|nr:hypothetical protein [Paenibacillus spiritus]KAA8997576.1 hypothetical protein F4V43_17600 [Paenibacillus spiritus]